MSNIKFSMLIFSNGDRLILLEEGRFVDANGWRTCNAKHDEGDSWRDKQRDTAVSTERRWNIFQFINPDADYSLLWYLSFWNLLQIQDYRGVSSQRKQQQPRCCCCWCVWGFVSGSLDQKLLALNHSRVYTKMLLYTSIPLYEYYDYIQYEHHSCAVW